MHNLMHPHNPQSTVSTEVPGGSNWSRSCAVPRAPVVSPGGSRYVAMRCASHQVRVLLLSEAAARLRYQIVL